MSWEQTLVTVLSATMGGKLYSIEAPEAVTPPYAVYQLTGGQNFNDLAGTADLMKANVQITVLSNNAAGIVTSCAAIRAAMRAANTAGTLENRPQGPGFDLPGDETILRGRSLDYIITATEA